MEKKEMMHAPIMPIAPKPSQYGIDPALVKKRVAEMPGMVSLKLQELFPDLPDVLIKPTVWMKWQNSSAPANIQWISM